MVDFNQEAVAQKVEELQTQGKQVSTLEVSEDLVKQLNTHRTRKVDFF